MSAIEALIKDIRERYYGTLGTVVSFRGSAIAMSCDQAAAELEQLRQSLEDSNNGLSSAQSYVRIYMEQIAQLRADLAKAQEENAELREALLQLCRWDDDTQNVSSESGVWNRARAVLAKYPHPEVKK